VRIEVQALARVDLQVMDRLCEALKVTPGELFERVKGKRR
jgi:DNA-binding Xre family transcriptional regulator